MARIKWEVIYDDTWKEIMRHVADRRFHFVKIIDMDDACGSDNKGQPKYHGELRQVDLNDVSERQLQDALKCCGAENEENLNDEWKARCCAEYGCAAPLWDESGGDRRELERKGKRESRALDDPDALEERMDRPVNKIGSSAREFARGDFDSALSRGLAEGNQSAQILAQMQSPLPRDQGLSAQVDLHAMPSDDPIAYMAGFMDGFQGSEMPAEREELAEAYIQGRSHGADVRLGRQPKPEWIR